MDERRVFRKSVKPTAWAFEKPSVISTVFEGKVVQAIIRVGVKISIRGKVIARSGVHARYMRVAAAGFVLYPAA